MTHQQLKFHNFCWWLLAFLVGFEIFLVVMHMVVNWDARSYIGTTRRMFHVDREGNLSSWFSAMQFLLLAITLGVIYCLSKFLDPEKRFTFIWLLCSAGAIYLSADEGGRIHEWYGTLLGRAIDDSEEGSLIYNWDQFPSYYWSIIYVPIAVPVAIFIGWFFWRELGRLRYLPMAGMTLFLIGAVVLDYLEGAYGRDDHKPWRVEFWGFSEIVDTALIEEAFEMVGVTLILAACLFHAANLASRVSIAKHE